MSTVGLHPAAKEYNQRLLEEGEQSTCPICMVEDTQARVVLACKHKFHLECIDGWLVRNHGDCPLCRGDIEPERQSAIAVLTGRVRQIIATAIPGVAPDDQGLLPMGVCEARARLVCAVAGFAMMVTGIVFLAKKELELDTGFMLTFFGLCTMVSSPCIGRFRQPEGHEPHLLH
jgi:hypothetical protein